MMYCEYPHNRVYRNGNTLVAIGDDGTKIRYIPDGQEPRPEFPESIDLKITNRCPVGCPVCHEQSTVHGLHADLKHPLLDSLSPGTELAIGGGDPMSHPSLQSFLNRMKKKDVICNMTVHWKSLDANYGLLFEWVQQGLIHGLGVSVNEVVPEDIVYMLEEIPNSVVHSIVGIADKEVFNQLMGRNLNILLLGYKTFGRGSDYIADSGNCAGIMDNRRWLSTHLKSFWSFRAVSFDNLAIEQLNLKSLLEPDVYSQFYMGDDGQFTMYVDLVKEEYAVSSISQRMPIDSENIRDLFAKVRGDREWRMTS